VPAVNRTNGQPIFAATEKDVPQNPAWQNSWPTQPFDVPNNIHLAGGSERPVSVVYEVNGREYIVTCSAGVQWSGISTKNLLSAMPS